MRDNDERARVSKHRAAKCAAPPLTPLGLSLSRVFSKDSAEKGVPRTGQDGRGEFIVFFWRTKEARSERERLLSSIKCALSQCRLLPSDGGVKQLPERTNRGPPPEKARR